MKKPRTRLGKGFGLEIFWRNAIQSDGVEQDLWPTNRTEASMAPVPMVKADGFPGF
ncbi:MAG: hypothetical protein LBM04_10270 [Opitutaceae bacterium]|jgi:hypothetical protein|nr:hypothetical protein [Opitutaceae bacterium]